MTYATAFSGRHFMSRNEKAYKFKRSLLQKEEPLRAKTLGSLSTRVRACLSSLLFLKDLLTDATKTSDEKVVF